MRTIIRALLALILVAVVGVLLLNYWPGGWPFGGARTGPASSGAGTINTERARERAAEIGERAADLGEKAAVATKKIQETVSEAGLTTKIKAKMALDDTLKSRAIDVSTEGSTVTVSGTVPTAAARDRALALARETAGVSVVIDRLEIRPPT
jgi:hyperosmotically inducible protein